MQKPSFDFGEKIRSIREKKSLTMKELAEKAGVSESLISQIERNKVSPAIDTLLAIVDVLDIDLEYLFSGFKREGKVNLVRKNERRHIVTKEYIYERLAQTGEPGDEHGIEAYVLVLPEGGKSGSTEYGHNGKELGLVMEGKAEFTIGTQTYALGEGDSISFSSNLPHLLKNVGSGVMKAFWVITPPKNV
jgi:transcriptional regulator with XRE-family HTH domain